MGDDTNVQPRTKETGPPSISCPILTSSNYTVWAMRMRVTLKVQEVWDTIEPGSVDVKKNNIAIALLFQSIPESLILQIGDLETSKEIWEALKTRNIGADRVKEARLQTLMADFDRLKMGDTDSIDDFAGKLSSFASKTVALGGSMEESKLVKKFLNCLPRSKYIQITASLEQVLNLNTTPFEEIVGRLKAYEERIRDEAKDNDQSKLLYSTDSYGSRGGFNNFRGRGRGGRGRGGRGRGRGRFNGHSSENDNTENPLKDRSKIVCFRCDKKGHFARACPERKKENQETNLTETQEADTPLYMHEVVFLNEENLTPKKFATEKQESDMWYLDNGASNHMTGNISYFSELNEGITGKVRFGDESCVDIKGRGSITFQGRNGEQKLLTEIYYIPELKNNILSLGQATESGCEVRMKNDLLTMHDENGRLLVRVTRSSNRLYKIRMGIAKPTCLNAKTDDASWRWHARFGHIGFAKLKIMAEKEIVTGMPKIVEENKICKSCLVGKQTRKSFPSSTSFRAEKPLELVHGDLCGPITPSTIAQNRYIFVLIDDFSRYMWTILLKEKGDAFEKFKRFKVLIEKESGLSIKTLRTDRGGEFMSKEFRDFCENTGIIRHLTAPYTPQQNGVVERRNRTLMEMTRSIMKSMRVPNYLWGEAVRHSTYLINRISTKALENLTPYESFKNKKPNIRHLRVFGCLSYAKVDSSLLKKLDDRSKKLVHLGTEPGSKAYRLYDPTTRQVVVSRDVAFDEGKCWRWGDSDKTEDYRPGMFQFEWGGVIDYGENIADNEEEAEGTETAETDEAEIDETGESGTFVDSLSASNSSSMSGTNSTSSSSAPQIQQPVLRRSTRQISQPKHLEDYILFLDIEIERLMLTINGEPETFGEAKDSQVWLEAMEDEILSINKNHTWKLVDKPANIKPIGLKWVFKIKKKSDGSISKHKARLVAKGYVQQHGIDYEDVFAPVARLETIRLLIALAATNGWEIHHLDVKTAFLHGELKEIVYVAQPEGFIKAKEKSKVYLLSKALYGLKQAPRAWNNKLDQILKGLRFQRCSKENSVYRKKEGADTLLVAIYVDDLFVTGSSSKIINDFKVNMAGKFEMSDLGKLTYYLGLEVTQGKDGISIHQEGYAKKVLLDTSMESCNHAHIPMDTSLKLSKAEDEQEIDATRYRRTIGCLRYLLHSRPDLSYAVGVLSRYMHSPRESHGQAIKHILRYVKGTTRYGLTFKRACTKELVGYSDSSHNIDPDDGRSTTGHVFYLGTSPITWCSQKQPTVALSSCEAEFMAATEAAKQAIWLKDLLDEVQGTEGSKVLMRIDNKSAIALTKNPVFHGRSKHILAKYHFIRECVENEQIIVEHIPGVEQKADILTKPLARIKFKEMRSLIGVEEIQNPEIHVGIKGDNVG